MIVWQQLSMSSSSSLPNLHRMNSSTSSPEKGDDGQLDTLHFLPSPNFMDTRIAQQVNDEHESGRVEGLAPSNNVLLQDQKPEKGSPLSTNKSSPTVPVSDVPPPTERSIITTTTAATTNPTTDTAGVLSRSSHFSPALSTYSEAESVLLATNDASAGAHPRPQTDQQTAIHQDDGTIRVQSGSGYRVMKPFPWRLHEILEEVRRKRLDWIVSWRPEGRSFQVHCQKSFTDIIIPMFFRHSRYKSFQRQLYLYGFRTLDVASIERGAYYHPQFQRDNRSLCRHIIRVKSDPPSSGRGNCRGSGNQSSKKRKSSNSRGGGKTTIEVSKSTPQTSVAHSGKSVASLPPSIAASAVAMQYPLDLEYSSGHDTNRSYNPATKHHHQHQQQHIDQRQQPQEDNSHQQQPSLLSQVINFDQTSHARQQLSGRAFSNDLLGFSEDIISLFGGNRNKETLSEDIVRQL